mgnify:CR=1 FL=1
MAVPDRANHPARRPNLRPSGGNPIVPLDVTKDLGKEPYTKNLYSSNEPEKQAPKGFHYGSGFGGADWSGGPSASDIRTRFEGE